MQRRQRAYVLDEQVKAIVADAQEMSSLILGSKIAYPEHFFLTLAFQEEELLKGILRNIKGSTYYSNACDVARKYLSEPIRHAHAGNTDELAAGMNKGLLKIIQRAAQIAGEMTDEDVVVVTLELILLAAESERVSKDIVVLRWGIYPNLLRPYYRGIGIPLPLTHTEQMQLWQEEADIINSLEALLKSQV